MWYEIQSVVPYLLNDIESVNSSSNYSDTNINPPDSSTPDEEST